MKGSEQRPQNTSFGKAWWTVPETACRDVKENCQEDNTWSPPRMAEETCARTRGPAELDPTVPQVLGSCDSSQPVSTKCFPRFWTIQFLIEKWDVFPPMFQKQVSGLKNLGPTTPWFPSCCSTWASRLQTALSASLFEVTGEFNQEVVVLSISALDASSGGYLVPAQFQNWITKTWCFTYLTQSGSHNLFVQSLLKLSRWQMSFVVFEVLKEEC